MTSKIPRSIIFLHIPKTAGTTFQSILMREYKSDSIFYLYGDKTTRSIDAVEKFKMIPENERMKIRALIGHMSFGLHEYMQQPAIYITFLRDPIERIISHYYYVVRFSDHYLHDKVIAENINLKDYVARGITDETNNGQTRLLSGVGKNLPYGCCPPEMLKAAADNISKHFPVVGISERFDESLILMKNLLGWRLHFYYKENVTKNRILKGRIPLDTLDVIRKYNQLDIQLYEQAKRDFTEMIARQPSSFQYELTKFRKFNEYLGMFENLINISKTKINRIFK
jgi:hypothetical protein